MPCVYSHIFVQSMFKNLNLVILRTFATIRWGLGIFPCPSPPLHHHDCDCTTSSSTGAQSLKPTATDVFQRLHASHAEAGQKAETLVVMNLIVKPERCHAKIHGAPDVEIGMKTSTIAKETERESESLVIFATLHVHIYIYMYYKAFIYMCILFMANKTEIKYDWHCHSSVAHCAKTRVEKLSMMKATVMPCGRCRLWRKSQMLFGRHPCRWRYPYSSHK